MAAINQCEELRLKVEKTAISLFKCNGSIDRYALYASRNGTKIAVVIREWELPKGFWKHAADIGRYKVYYHQ